MPTKIANSAAGNTIFDVNGSAITSSTQPTNNQTSSVGAGTSSSYRGQVRLGADSFENFPETRYSSLAYIVENGDTTPDGSQVQLSGLISANGGAWTRYGIPTGVSAVAPNDIFVSGDRVITDRGHMLTLNEVTATGVVFNAPYNTGYFTNSTPYIFDMPQDIMKGSRKNVYAAIGVDATFAGDSNTASVLRSGSTEPNRSVNAREAVRTVQTASAIRAGHWNEFAGDWDTDPTGVNDTAIFKLGIDSAYSGLGRVTYQYGGATPTNDDLDNFEVV